MSLKEAQKLSINDKIDHRDFLGCYVKATIIDKKENMLKIDYENWDDEWNVWSNCESELFRFAKYKSISERPQHRFFHLQKGDKVDINPSHHPGWYIAEIKKFELGQIETSYTVDDYDYVFWTHIDNENEIAQVNTFTNNVESNGDTALNARLENENIDNDMDMDALENSNNKNDDNDSDNDNVLQAQKCDSNDASENNNNENNDNDTCCIDNLEPFAIGRRLGGYNEIHRPKDAYFKCKICGKIYGPFH
eukprot:175837_1